MGKTYKGDTEDNVKKKRKGDKDRRKHRKDKKWGDFK